MEPETRSEVGEEIEFHVSMRAAELEASGVPPEEARARALARFGAVDPVRREMEAIQERRRRRSRRLAWLRELGRDVAWSARTLRKRPGFTAVAVLTVALGTGANAAMFGVVDPLLLRPLPYEGAGRLVALWSDRGAVSRAEYVAMRDRMATLESAGGYRTGLGFTVGGESAPATRVRGAQVTVNLFDLLGARPLVGRAFLPEEAGPGRSDVVVLSAGVWRERYGGDPTVVGRTVTVEGRPHTVVGVMPSSFSFPTRQDRIWVPVPVDASQPGELWGYSPLTAVGRLAPGATPHGAAAELRALAGRLRLENPLWTPPETYGEEAKVEPLAEYLAGELRRPLLVLLAAVGVVLLIACVNVANLLLARSAGRRQELAVRRALGASRGRLIRQLLTESLMMALGGGVAGVLLAHVGLRALTAGLPPDTPRLADVGLDPRVLVFTLTITLVAGLLFGLAPALRESRGSSEALRSVAGAGLARSQRRLSAVLVAAEVALAVLLVTGAGLLLRSFRALTAVDPGFATERVLTARLSPPESLYRDDARRRALHTAILERVRTLPDVESAALTSQLPFDRDPAGTALAIPGITLDPNDLPMFGLRRVTPDFLDALGIPLLAGRRFTTGDDDVAPAVALIDETAARAFFGDRDPIGATVGFPWFDEWLTVVGVVTAVRNAEPGAPVEPTLYRPFAQDPVAEMKLVVRTRAAPDALAAALPGLVAGVDPGVAVSDVQPIADWIDRSLTRPRFATVLLGLFALLALILGAVGIYGVISQAVAQRVREFGVRVALGARAADVVRLTLREASVLTGTGVVLGAAAAVAVTRLLRPMLYDIGPHDPLVFLATPLILALVGLLAAWVPARRAAAIDPTETLRT